MNPCFIIAEAGVNHNGSEEMALQLIEAAALAGADAVKFQSFKAESLVAKGTVTAEYQKEQTGSTDQYAMLKQLELSEDQHISLIGLCNKLNIEFMSTPFDIEAARFLVNHGMKHLKVPSGEITNIPFIRALAAFNRPIILSTGMSELDEVREAVESIAMVREKSGFTEPLIEMLSILHCTSNYPTSNKDVNLKAMQTMGDEFSLPIGYSDHTDGILVSVAAVAMNAKIIEKHFTLDRELPGPDHQASLMPDELKLMIQQIRRIEECLGDGLKVPRDSELPVRELVRRSVTLVNDMKEGDVIASDDLVLLRPGSGIPPKELDKVIGRQLKSSLKAGTTLEWQDLL